MYELKPIRVFISTSMILSILLPSLFLTGDTNSLSEKQKKDKRVIEFGWDIPDTEFVKNNISEMEKKPFNGVVLNVKYNNQDKYLESIAFSNIYLQYEGVSKAIEDLKATNFEKFTDNFLRFNVTPGNVDWYDDCGPILNNVEIATRITKEGELKGIFLDVEQYGFPLFKYRSLKYKSAKSFNEYVQQARTRGKQFIETINRIYPDITIILTFGYYLGTLDGKDLSHSDYSLLPAFLDGILEGSSAQTAIADGFEFSYGFRVTQQFIEGYKIIKEKSLELGGAGLKPAPTIEDKYRSIVKAGFGLWLDYDSGSRRWHTNYLSKNYFTPEEFKNSLISAQTISDKYVWIYSERLNWWTDNNLPKAYIDAVRGARE